MAERLTKEARQIVEAGNAPNPAAHREWDAEVSAAEAEDSTIASEWMGREVEALNESTDSLLIDACAARDALETLASDETIAHAELQERFEPTRRELDRLARQRADLLAQIERLEASEADPVAYVDSLRIRYPRIRRRSFTF